MAEAAFGNTVKVHYKVKLEDGTVVDSTEGQDPFMFTIGMGQAIAGFEKAVMGMSPGSSETVKVEAEDGYGPYYKELIKEIDLDQFPEGFKFEAGQRYEFPRPDGQFDLVTVLQVTEKTVIIDANHPLSGKELIMEVSLVEIL